MGKGHAVDIFPMYMSANNPMHSFYAVKTLVGTGT